MAVNRNVETFWLDQLKVHFLLIGSILRLLTVDKLRFIFPLYLVPFHSFREMKLPGRRNSRLGEHEENRRNDGIDVNGSAFSP